MNSRNHSQDSLIRWYAEYPGRLVLQTENQMLNESLPTLFGTYLLQLGQLKTHCLLTSSLIHHTIYYSQQIQSNIDSCGLYRQMPFANSSFDAIFLPHILEYEPSTSATLAEAVRMLVPEGYLIITGFNPWSLAGIGYFITRAFSKGSLGKPIPLMKLSNQLYQHNIEQVLVKTSFYRPFLTSNRWMNRLKFLEVLGKIFCPRMGSIYLLVGRKKVLPLSPIKPTWKVQLTSIGKEIASPSTRSCNRDKTC